MQTRSPKKSRALFALLLAFALIAAACGGDDDDTSTAEAAVESSDDGAAAEEPAAEPAAEATEDFSDFKVVMILDGSAEDGGWSNLILGET